MSVRVKRGLQLIAGFALALGATSPAAPSGPTLSAKPLQMAGTISTADWEAYRSRFIDDSGRVIDNANGNISHSEGQGYGLLLAFAAGDRRTFEKIWTFTLTELLIRDDGLVAWKWDPSARPRVSDRNNASDGDILVAYALAKAGAAWKDTRYTAAARKMARAIGKNNFARHNNAPLLLPATTGFGADDRPDGPVVNLSYWIFEAFPVLAPLAPEYDWSGVWKEGVSLLYQATSGRARLPADWVSVRTKLQTQPADGFPPEFGYNSLRISLYLLRAGMTDLEWLRTLNQRWSTSQEGVAVVNVVTGQPRERLTDQGYAVLSAMLACALDGKPLPGMLKMFEPKLYYPSTLYLLSMSLISERYPQCL
ncbi:glycosyl hydrolase family 8 [Microvirga terricola]|uniref:cellulase n=1 Tax=Microvirga terricola TaxID=2719797 RepID=A0ABX0VFK3_9HYPH|nr:glycosyl hydrolase family 8 [Microvirga terricola]NIX78296.1 endoglucanase [Microvirga terricola]